MNICKSELKLIIFFIFIFALNSISAQEYPKDYFRSPVKIPIYLSGSFSELRTNHFHSGIDIKTNGQQGLKIVAVADGYVSRIRVSPYGFGNALYINHPNGFTSVYAHLSKFSDDIESFVKKNQYHKKKYAIQLYPSKNKFVFKKGELIGLSGNSGSSRGPHLHFEIRDTKSEWPINPLYFGLKITDEIKPEIRRIKLYPVNESFVVKVTYYGKNSTYSKFYHDEFVLRLSKSNGNYILRGVKNISVNGAFKLGIETYDKMNNSYSTLGVYNILLKVNDENIFEEKFNTFSFANSRYINAHIDYAEKVHKKKKIQRLFLLPNNKLPFYETINNNGEIITEFGKENQINIFVKDFSGNMSVLKFKISGEELKSNTKNLNDESYRKIFSVKEANYFYDDEINLFAFPNTFYDDLKFKYRPKEGNSNTYSKLHIIHKNDVPVHKRYILKIKTQNLPEKYKDKAYIAVKYGKNSFSYLGGKLENGWIETKVREFGTFCVVVDSVDAVIKALNFKNGSYVSSKKELKLKIYDKQSGISSYNGYIDGKWVLMEYDAKYNLLKHKFDSRTSSGKHSLKVVVKDNCGNKKVAEFEFVR
ncbi:MAG: M23 family metallopeptidase [Bacteroidota bacterium]|nr:M23 family metallopeptidase [Bacteroidota bacterium]